MKLTLKNMVLMVCMLTAAFAGWRFAPKTNMATLNQDIQLENSIPKAFGDWRMEESGFQSVVNPQQKGLLDFLYSQTLGRTYANSNGQRIMLSIAYGKNQAGESELHRPEVCYVAQGFKMERYGSSTIPPSGANSSIPVQHLIARQSKREEPITYWMRVGDDIVASGSSQQFSRVRHGLKGLVPDGILFRVSSISLDPDHAYKLQQRFIVDLLAAVDPRTRHFLVGPVSTAETSSR